jgi:hypothetical protein
VRVVRGTRRFYERDDPDAHNASSLPQDDGMARRAHQFHCQPWEDNPVATSGTPIKNAQSDRVDVVSDDLAGFSSSAITCPPPTPETPPSSLRFTSSPQDSLASIRQMQTFTEAGQTNFSHDSRVGITVGLLLCPSALCLLLLSRTASTQLCNYSERQPSSSTPSEKVLHYPTHPLCDCSWNQSRRRRSK